MRKEVYMGGSVYRGPWDHEIMFVIYQYILNNTKQNRLLHWDLRKQFVMSGILLYQISLYRLSTGLIFI